MASGSLIQFPLRLGLADDSNKKSPPVSSLKRGHNVRWVRDGVLGKRFGYEQFGVVIDMTEPLRFIPRGDTLSFTNGKKLYTYSPTTTLWNEADRVGELGLEWSTLIDDAAGVSQSDIVVRDNVLLHAYITGDPSIPAGSSANTLFEFTPFVQAIDWQTGRIILPPTSVNTGAEFMRLLLCGSYAVLITCYAGQIFASRILLDEALGVAVDPSFQVLVSDARHDDDPHGIESRFDAMVLPSGDIVIAYEQVDGGGSSLGLEIKKYSVAAGVLTYTSNRTESTATDVRCVALGEGGGVLFCAYSRAVSDPECRVFVYTSATADLSLEVGPVEIEDDFRAHHIAVDIITTTKAVVVYAGIRERSVHWPETRSVIFDTDTELPTLTTLRASPGVIMTSGVFLVGGRRYVFARDAHYGERQYWDPTWTDGLIFGREENAEELSKLPSMSSYLIEVEYNERTDLNDAVPHRVVGKIDHDIAAPFKQGFTSRTALVDNSTTLGATPFQATAEPQSFGFRNGLRLVTATVDLARRSDPWRCVSIATETYIGGSGMLWAWDGRSVFDLAMRTPMILFAGENSDDGKMADGDYTYQVQAEYRSHAGILHRGPMSIPITVTTNDGVDHLASAKLILVSNSIDSKETPAFGFGALAALKSYFNVFRSEANGSIVYERTFGPRFDFLLNVPTAGVQTFTDMLGDEDIAFNSDAPADAFSNPQVPLASRPQPYVATGELEDVQPPASLTACLHLGRVVLLLGDRRTVWFSKSLEDNPGIAPGFNQDFVRLFDRDVQAFASHADRLIIFFERGAKFMVGDGPTVANTDDRFSTPQSLPGEIGTTNPRSVVATPLGVFFQATGGDIYLLDGGLAMQWIGKDVRDTLVTYPTITSAVHVAEQREVRFTAKGRVQVGTGESGEPEYGDRGIMIVFDYGRGTWITRSTPNDAVVTDACVWDGQYVFATAPVGFIAAGVFRETANHFDNLGSGDLYIPSEIVLNPIAPSGPMAWHRMRLVQLIGASLDVHTLTIGIARNYAATVEQTKVYDGTSPVTAAGPFERAQVAPRIQKMQAIEVHISDAVADVDNFGYGGFELEGVALFVETLSGPARIEKAKRG